jgi:hypothetical protein
MEKKSKNATNVLGVFGLVLFERRANHSAATRTQLYAFKTDAHDTCTAKSDSAFFARLKPVQRRVSHTFDMPPRRA